MCSLSIAGEVEGAEPLAAKVPISLFAAVQQTKIPHPNAPPADKIDVRAKTQEREGKVTHLRGSVEIETSDMLLKADEVDYDQDNDYAEARGHVYYKNYLSGEIIEADRVEYYLKEQKGKYYHVHGTTPAKIDVKPGILTTTNPFRFEGEWAERVADHYTLYHGSITDCLVPRPWWTLRAPRYDIVPGEKALAYHAVFRLRGIPLFYTPFFYKSLEKLPRRSGFLTPNIGNSSRRGKTVGLGYFWAIDRSYDAMYRVQYFSERGFAHTVDVRGKPSDTSDFNVYLYGVNDSGRPAQRQVAILGADGSTIGTQTQDYKIKEGGFLSTVTGHADLGDGFQARGIFNYLSSFTFRQAFTDTFNEAIFSEVSSTGYITKQWSGYSLDFVASRIQNFQTAAPADDIVIEKLPNVEFRSRDRQLTGLHLPVYFSFDSSGGLMERLEPQFDSKRLLGRVNLEPKISMAVHWKGIHIVPYFSLRATDYSAQLDQNSVVTDSLFRTAKQAGVEVILPSLSRIYNSGGIWGEKIKHVIEPRAVYRYVTGVNDYTRTIRFDDVELLSDTNEVEVSIANRLLTKSKTGEVREAVSWEVSQKRYFDPTFGGALLDNRRNVLYTGLDLTAYSFFDTPRTYSPIVSALRINPDYRVSFEWRTDYDPKREKIVNSLLTANIHWSKYTVTVGNNEVKSATLLSPPTNEFTSLIGYGQDNRKGWSAAVASTYDYRNQVLRYANTQISYNTDCCGFQVQYRRLAFGTRNENQFRLAFVVANLGSFGTLKRQEKIF